ncbi:MULTISPECIES: phosphatase PAP2 family protein [unclassified Ruminococcus]|uniref:phosphatase PAP2 family protein n=1 Tax=unclassified Ruminococcus TaxID=2608920 RepID=UPI00210C25B6|nr:MULTISPECIES: phosphatase PAP2 family protein [unclassified Ruminococcus]MCQ4022648.1 phosphatase PAP2 family protein [Ruminococcus sp. zg-924]MCQ4114888.1 phosphatase PAP2 family protein [Ruminococcus sp. zg-921]
MEIEILNFIQQNLENPVFSSILIFFTNIVEHGEVWILTGIIMLITKKYRKAGLLLLITLVITFVSSELIIKNLVCRPRPFLENPDIQLMISPPHGYSFPSSHSAVSFASATVIFYFNKKFGVAAYVVATLTAFSRLYLYVHYPTDVLGGIVLGVAIAIIVISVYNSRKILSKIKRNN